MVNINDYPLTLTDIVDQSARNLDPPLMNLPANSTNKLALCSLKLDNSIKIFDSDKNLGPVVDTTWYNEQCFLTLTDESTYKEVTIRFFENSIFNAQAELRSLIDKYEHLLQDGSLPDKHREFLFSQSAPLDLQNLEFYLKFIKHLFK